jgi:hypothetical protein
LSHTWNSSSNLTLLATSHTMQGTGLEWGDWSGILAACCFVLRHGPGERKWTAEPQGALERSFGRKLWKSPLWLCLVCLAHISSPYRHHSQSGHSQLGAQLSQLCDSSNIKNVYGSVQRQEGKHKGEFAM